MKTRPRGLVPAAARSMGGGRTVITADEAGLSDAALVRFERVLGRREAFAEMLAVADGEPDVARIMDLLLDPRYDAYSLRRLCTMTGLTVADFFAAYMKAAIVRAHIQVAPIIAAKLVGVVDDLMTRAQPHYLPCPVCRGAGTLVPEPTKEKPTPSLGPCASCIDGKQLVLPDLDRQKLALEVAELIKPRSGMIFNQANLLNAGEGRPASGGPGALEQLQQAASAILFARPAAPPVLTAIVADPPSDVESPC